MIRSEIQVLVELGLGVFSWLVILKEKKKVVVLGWVEELLGMPFLKSREMA